jgi:hypothetical protein
MAAWRSLAVPTTPDFRHHKNLLIPCRPVPISVPIFGDAYRRRRRAYAILRAIMATAPTTTPTPKPTTTPPAKPGAAPRATAAGSASGAAMGYPPYRTTLKRGAELLKEAKGRG